MLCGHTVILLLSVGQTCCLCASRIFVMVGFCCCKT